MKHCLFGLLFLLFFTKPVLASIDLTISDIAPKEDYYQLTAKVTGMSSSSATYIQAMFSPQGISKYFGFTFSKDGKWLKYDGSPEKQYVLDNFPKLDNDVPTTIYLKPDYDDPDYQGSGIYTVKLKRYTSSGSPSDYSNSLEISLNQTKTTPSPTTTSTPTPTSTPISTPKVTTQNTPIPSQKAVTTPTVSLSITPPNIKISPQVLSTSSSLPEINLGEEFSAPMITPVASQSAPIAPKAPISDRSIFLIGFIILSSSGGLLYFRHKNH